MTENLLLGLGFSTIFLITSSIYKSVDIMVVFNNTYKFDEVFDNPNLCVVCGRISSGGINVGGERHCDLYCYMFRKKHPEGTIKIKIVPREKSRPLPTR